MRIDHTRRFSHRLGRDMGVAVFGHWGPPLLTFPTSGGNEWEYQDQSLMGALAPIVDAGRNKVISVETNSGDSFYNRPAHPYHRSWMQRRYDEYVREEVVPYIWSHCQSRLDIATMGASLGAYHAANSLFKHPDVFKRCFAISGVYDMKRFMDGLYDENFYFNNPVDYLANLADPWHYQHLATCDIHIVTGHGPFEDPTSSYRLSDLLRGKGIHHWLDDWGPLGGHDWPYWKHQMREYVSKLY
jgi:esterase/lipase superfamily enzyme